MQQVYVYSLWEVVEGGQLFCGFAKYGCKAGLTCLDFLPPYFHFTLAVSLCCHQEASERSHELLPDLHQCTPQTGLCDVSRGIPTVSNTSRHSSRLSEPCFLPICLVLEGIAKNSKLP